MDRPADLGPRGGAFWDHVHATYTLSDVEEQLVLDVVRTMDHIERFDTWSRSGTDPQLQLSAAREARQQRTQLARALTQIGFPTEDDEVVPTPMQRRGSNSARARWAQTRRLRDDDAG